MNATSKQLYQAIKEQIIPITNTTYQGNKFYNTIIEISNNAMDITFNNLIEALIDNKELILSDDIIDNIDDNVLDEVFNQFCRDLSYG